MKMNHMFVYYYVKEFWLKLGYLLFTSIIWSMIFYEYMEEMHRIFTINMHHFKYMNFFGFISTNLNEFYYLNLYLLVILNVLIILPYLMIYFYKSMKSLNYNSSYIHISIISYVFTLFWSFFMILPKGWDIYYYDLTMINMYLNISNYYEFMIQGLYFFIFLFQLPYVFHVLCFSEYVYVLYYYKYKHVILVDMCIYMCVFFLMDAFIFICTSLIWFFLFDFLLIKGFYNDYKHEYDLCMRMESCVNK